MEQKEEISETDASVLNGVIAWAWMVKDYWECVEDKGSIWSKKWN